MTIGWMSNQWKISNVSVRWVYVIILLDNHMNEEPQQSGGRDSDLLISHEARCFPGVTLPNIREMVLANA
jgi:hypothetical protein